MAFGTSAGRGFGCAEWRFWARLAELRHSLSAALMRTPSAVRGSIVSVILAALALLLPAAAAAQPVLQVYGIVDGSAVAVPNGSSSPSAATDFGTVEETGSVVVRYFLLYNPGDAPLNITDISVSPGSVFRLTQNNTGVIGAGGSQSVPVEFDPNAGGPFSETISVSSDDPNNPSYTFQVFGEGVATSGPTVTLGALTDAGSNTFTSSITFSAPVTGFTASDLVTTNASATLSGSGANYVVTLSPAASGQFSVQVPANVAVDGSGRYNRPSDIRTATFNPPPGGVLRVTGRGNTIASGDTSPRNADGTFYGEVVVGESAVDRTFVLHNDGASTLTVSSVTVDNATGSAFSLVGATPNMIAPDGTASITIRFDPAAEGAFDAVVRIGSDDPDSPIYSFTVQGAAEAAAPAMFVFLNGSPVQNGAATTPGTDFGTIAVGASDTRQFVVYNAGNADLTFAASASPIEGYRMSIVSSGTIPAGSFQAFDVFFDPKAEGDFPTTVSIASNDPNTPVFTFDMEGSAVAPVPTAGTISPAEGPAVGGTTVSIAGTGFLTAQSVTFDGTAATSFTVVSDTEIEAVSPAHASGAVDIVVTTAGGTATATNGYTYLASSDATLASLSVSEGTLSPAFDPAETDYAVSVGEAVATIALTPTASDAGATITVAGIAVTSGQASDPIALSAGQNMIAAEVTAPDGTTRQYNVVVTRALSSDASLAALSVSEGTLTPAFDTARGSYTVRVASDVETITVTPTASDAGATIRVNGTATPSGTATAPIPLVVGTTPITVQVMAANGASRVYSLPVTRAAPPTVQVYSMTGGQAAVANGSTAATPGTDFGQVNVGGQGTRLFVVNNAGDAPLTLTGLSVTPSDGFSVPALTSETLQPGGSYQFTIPFRPTSTGDVTATVSIASNDPNAPTYSFAVYANGVAPLPTIGSVSPDEGVARGGASVTITGTGFLTAQSVTFGGTDATAFTVLSDTAIQATTPEHPAGAVDVVVTSPGGSATATDGYTFLSGDSTLASLVPSDGTLSPTFDAAEQDYSVRVAHSVDMITLTPTANDAGATITVDGNAVASGSASASIALPVGVTRIVVRVNAADGTNRQYSVTVTRAPSDDATLSALTVSEGSLTPAFDTGELSYAVAVAHSVTSIVLTPTASDAGATIRVAGSMTASGSASTPVALNAGTTSIAVIVTAADGTTQQYTVAVTRAPSSDATLVSLVPSDGALSPAFDPAELSYAVSVGNDVDTITLTPRVADAGATVAVAGNAVTSGNASAPVALPVGTTSIAVVVTAADGTTQQYDVAVTRVPSNDAKLSALTLSEGTLQPAFGPFNTNYLVDVANSVTSITVTPTAADADATITVAGNAVASGSASAPVALTIGSNAIAVVVTAADGTMLEYTIAVTRAASSDATLSDLAVSEGTLTPAFDPGRTSYAVAVDTPVDSIRVKPTVSDAGATVTVAGNAVASGSASAPITLNVGTNSIPVTVTAGNGATLSYTLSVTRAAPPTIAMYSTTGGVQAIADGTTSATPGTDFGEVMVGASASRRFLITNTGNADLVISGITATPAAGFEVPAESSRTIVPGGSYEFEIRFAPTSEGSFATTIAVASNDPATPSFSYSLYATAAAPLPTITGITPTEGSASGGTAVTITGTGFLTATSVTFDGVAADAFTVVSDTRIDTTTPANPLGTVDVVVTSPGGAATATDGYRYLSGEASLSGLSVSEGTLTPTFDPAQIDYSVSVGSTVDTITLTPTASDAGATITVAGNAVSSGSASAPVALSVGTTSIDVVVTAADGTTRQYAVAVARAAPPTIGVYSSSDGVQPIANGATSATPGTDFGEVAVGSSGSRTFLIFNDGDVDLVVSGIAASPAAGFTLPTASSTTIAPGGSFEFPIVFAPQTDGSFTTTIAITSNDPATPSFTYSLYGTAAAPIPMISDVAPAEGPLSGGTGVAITGTGFLTVTSVTFAGENADAFTVVSDTRIDATTPANVAGTVDVVVSSPGGAATATRSFTYLSNDATLSTLAVSEGVLSPTFDPARSDYTVSVGNAVDTIALTPSASDADATITVAGKAVASGSASAPVALPVGTTTIEVVVTAADGTDQRYTVAVTRAVSSDAALSALGVSEGALSPAFDPAQASYTVSVGHEVETIALTPSASDAGATITVAGNAVASGSASAPVALSVGTTSIAVVVTAADGTTRQYTVAVTRAASSDAALSALSVSEGTLTPSFDASQTSYTVSVGNAVDTVTLTPSASDADATITVAGNAVASGSASAPVALPVGTTPIAVVVTAPDGTTQTYTVAITRAASNDAQLSSLSVSEGTLSPAFDPAQTNYAVSVGSTVDAMTLSPTASDADATITVAGDAVASGSASAPVALSVGTTSIPVVVTAADGTTRQYTVAVTRAAPPTLAVYSTSGGVQPIANGSASTTPGTDFGQVMVGSSESRGFLIFNEGDADLVVSGITATPAAGFVVQADASRTIAPGGSYEFDIRFAPKAIGGVTATVTIASNDAATPSFTYNLYATGAAPVPTIVDIAPAEGLTVGGTTVAITGTGFLTANSVTFAGVQANAFTVVSDTQIDATAPANSAGRVDVVVTSPGGSATATGAFTYLSNDAALSALGVSEGALSPAFDPAQASYTVSVGHEVDTITLTPSASDVDATITVAGNAVASGSASAPVALPVGTTTIEVVVTAADGTTQQYTVAVTRAASSDAALSALSLSEGALSPSFDASQTSYTVSVSNEVETITLTPSASDADATITVAGNAVASGSVSAPVALPVGTTSIAVVVTAPDGTTRQYTVAVTRAASSDAQLSALSVSEGTLSPAFDPGQASYTVSVGNEVDTITLTPSASDADATITVAGNAVTSGSASSPVALPVGTTPITVVVTAPDGTTQSYSVAVTRAASNDAQLSALSASEGALSPSFDASQTSYTVSVGN
ncbi:cadherin-like beta sandwich domain-containing protein, partial [Citromicrobium bathyomarinum]|uniref:beta strand repeat-containing protein n=1 Tax=Citromicrobium bathyomarinum TaxID=72174 RepID=UPI00315999AF